MIVDAKLDQIDIFKLVSYMAQSQVSNKVKGFQAKKSDTIEVPESNALKVRLKMVLFTNFDVQFLSNFAKFSNL